MTKRSQVGLVVEGNAIASTVLRLPNLSDDLGPVKSATVRVSRRLCNTYRAGYAVASYEDLQAANLILLRMPDAAVPRVVEELCTSELIFKDISFVLCESWLTIDVLHLLEKRGASVATLMILPTTQRDWFAVEGSPKAVRQTRRFLERNGARTDELKPGSKHFLFASALMATALPLPMLITAQQALRASGFSGNILSSLLEEMTLKMLQDFLRGARAVWGGPLTECGPEVSEGHLRQLRESDPQLAAYVNAQIALAKDVMTPAEPA